ncbi:integral membrane protein [Phlyctema vagabunda]|uniref:Integral membrane protein n=1 Tax=Phlyctema vagabunda TaxID=108571 RepID=A0ABR4PMK4_9HELO
MQHHTLVWPTIIHSLTLLHTMAENRGPQILGVAGLFLALSTLAVAARTYCRIVVVKSFGLDDYAAVVAWVFFAFFCAFAITAEHHGSGKHIGNIPPADVPLGLKWWWACEPVYVLSNMALKFSIGIFLLRIAVARTHRIIIWTTVAVIEIYSVVFFFLFVLQCRPSKYFWTRYTGGSGTCMNPKITVDATYVYSAISCWSDWTLAIIPVFLVWNLQMNSRTKLVVAVILAMGAIASTATIIRIPYVKDLANQADFLYATTDVAIWSTSETGIGITASCIATLRPLFRNFFLRSHLMGGSSTRGGTSPWPQYTPNASGYIKSKNKGTFNDEIALRNDVGKTGGVTTIIDADLERAEKGGRPEWQGEVSSDDGNSWGSGIRKTTVSTQQRN